jgi:hypothetical protein
MKARTALSAIAGAFALFASGQASAFFEGVIGNIFVVELDNPGTAYPDFTAPTFNQPPNVSTGYSVQVGTLPNSWRSPFDDVAGNPTAASALNPYGVIQAGGFARWNVFPSLGISFLWGSPDYFNRVEFFNGSTSVGFITGADLTNANRNPPQDPATGQSWVVLSPISGFASWTSVVFSSGINAFEFTSLRPTGTIEGGCGAPPPAEAGPICRFAPNVPLPAALPLFVTGLGALGLLGWRRKRKQAA